MKTDEAYYFDPHPILTRNAMFNFIVGARGVGKTYAFKKLVLRNWIRYKAEFVYVRRYATEILDLNNFFVDIIDEFPDYEVKVQGKNFLIKHIKSEKWSPFGYAVALSKAVTKKSVSYKNVTVIGFDEFIIKQQHYRYIKDEVTQFQEFYNTVDRYDDRVRVLFMANALSIMNPYFTHYGINATQGKEIKLYRDGYIAVQVVNGEDYAREAAKTRFGKFLGQSKYGEYAVDNVFLDANDTFIRPHPSKANPLYGFKFNGKVLAFYEDRETRLYHGRVGNIDLPKRIFTLNVEEHTEEVILTEKTSLFLKTMVGLYKRGFLYFNTPQAREQFIYIVGLTV